MQLPILSGIYADNSAEFRVEYPLNMSPIAMQTGISDSYLKPYDGIRSLGATAEWTGIDRGAFTSYFGSNFRVMGDDLVVLVNDQLYYLGTVGGAGTYPKVKFAQSTDYLAIVSDGELWFWDYTGLTLTQNTDPNVGVPIDVVFIDGYFVLTDGEFIYITEIGDPFTINPLKYGSSEIEPDPIVGLMKIRNELYAVNTTTIETFQNVGGELFPFQRVEGANIDKGSAGTDTFAYFLGNIMFVGNGINEAPGVWMALNADYTKVSTLEIDKILEEYGSSILSNVLQVEVRVDKNHQQFFMHFFDRTIVYDHMASTALQRPIWFYLSTSESRNAYYKCRNMVWADNRWIVSDGAYQLGTFDDTISSHFGELVGWAFSTNIGYNESNGAIFNSLELVSTPGRVALGDDPSIWTSYSLDGQTWSEERPIQSGKQGNRTKRLVWHRQGHMRNYRIQRFRGNSDSHISFARLEAELERLAY